MILHALFQGHKLFHLLIPFVLILLFGKRFGVWKVSAFSLVILLMKEIWDTIVIHDPLWVSAMDIILNFIGIGLGVLAFRFSSHLGKQRKQDIKL